jgi:hypothetical protein
LPYLAAELVAICLWRLRELAQSGIIHWFTTGHSALGGEIPLPPRDYSALTRGFIAYLPIAIVTIVAVVWLFVAAFLVTAAMVRSIEREQALDERKILADIATGWHRILLFALKLLVTLGVFFAGTTALLFSLLFIAHRQDLLRSPWMIVAMLPIAVGGSVWTVMPAAMRLLKQEPARLDSIQTRNQGAILAILTSEAGVALGLLTSKLETPMLITSHWEFTALSIINSVIANAPDTILFVALVLLAAGLSTEIESNDDSSLRELLPALMPMHFGKPEEPPQTEA